MIGATDGAAELLPARRRNEAAGDRIRAVLRKRIARLLRIRAAEQEAAAVKLIGTRLGLRGYDAGDCLAELGVVVLQRDFGFGHGVQVRIHNDDSENRILVVGSIQFECGAAEVLALGKDLQAALRIFGGGMAPAHHLLRARRHQLQVGEVPVQDGNVLNVLVIEGRGYIGAVGLS